MTDLTVELREVLLEEGDVTAEPSYQLLVDGLIATVCLHVDHPDDLPPPAHEFAEVTSLRLGQRPGRRPHAFGKEGDHLSVERVGLGQPAHRPGKVADLAWVDDAERQADGGQRGSYARLETARGFQDDKGNRSVAEAVCEGLQSLHIPGDMKGLIRGSEVNVETILGYVDADENGGCSSMTLPCKCGLGPERLSGFGTVAMRAAPCSVAGLRARGKHGLTLTV